MARNLAETSTNPNLFVFLFIINLKIKIFDKIGFIKFFNNKYTEEFSKNLKQYSKLSIKLQKLILDRSFLSKCKSHQIIPTCCKFKTSFKRLNNSKLTQKMSLEILSNEIEFKTKQIKKTKTVIEKIKLYLFYESSLIEWYLIRKRIKSYLKKHKEATVATHNKKLFNLGINPTPFEESADRFVNRERVRETEIEFFQPIFNLSNRPLNEIEKRVLSKGLRFGIKSRKIDTYEILTRFELVAQYIDSKSLKINNEQIDKKQAFLHQFKAKALEFLELSKNAIDSLTEEEHEALKELSKDETIIISKADKGNAVVIQNKSDYINKLIKLIEDKTKFECIEDDPTIEREKKLKERLLRLKKKGCIDKNDLERIKPSGSRAGVLYGLPKVHKKDSPIRPIISSIGTYNYNLASFLDNLIKPTLSISKYILKDSFDFVNRISKFDAKNIYIVSFDVESLFTNIPIDETINIAIDLCFGKEKKFYNFSKIQFKKLLEICTKESHFEFKGNYFNQIDGVAMGSPLAPTLANIFMHHLETKYMAKLKDLGVVEWLRYVDDTFVLIKSKENLEAIYSFLNSMHPSIKFTYETEKRNNIAFLDVLVSRDREKFSTSIFRKKTFTGVLLNWNSLTSKRYKLNLITCLLTRAYNICSNLKLFDIEIKKIKKILIKNDYPENIIDLMIEKFMNKKFDRCSNPKDPATKDKKDKIYLVLPFINENMDRFGQDLTKLVASFFTNIELKVVFKAPSEIKNLFNFKDKIINSKKSNVVYRVNCADCGSFYIGKTKRQLVVRLEEHKKGVGQEEYKSALFKHQKQTGHKIDYEGVEVLDSADSDRKLLLKEMLLINLHKPDLNTQVKSELFRLIL